MEVIFDVSDMKDFAAFVLYYSANPNIRMRIPNVAYKQVDRLWKKTVGEEKWFVIACCVDIEKA